MRIEKPGMEFGCERIGLGTTSVGEVTVVLALDMAFAFLAE